jgi:hypothetical protein
MYGGGSLSANIVSIAVFDEPAGRTVSVMTSNDRGGKAGYAPRHCGRYAVVRGVTVMKRGGAVRERSNSGRRVHMKAVDERSQYDEPDRESKDADSHPAVIPHPHRMESPL